MASKFTCGVDMSGCFTGVATGHNGRKVEYRKGKRVACDKAVCESTKSRPLQTEIPYRCDLLPMQALLRVSEIMKQGCAKYGANSWKHIPIVDHLNHALAHVFSFLAGDDTDEDDLANATCRMLFALHLRQCMCVPVAEEDSPLTEPFREYVSDDDELKSVSDDSDHDLDWAVEKLKANLDRVVDELEDIEETFMKLTGE